jgi:hypothetical protein
VALEAMQAEDWILAVMAKDIGNRAGGFDIDILSLINNHLQKLLL